MSETTRRSVLAGVAGVGAAAALAACGGGDGGSGPGNGQPTGAAPTTGGAPATTGGGAAGALGKTADVPVGAGKVFAAQKVVVTQPTAGEFKAFSAVCTHQGCPMRDVTSTINCSCHGSQYSITDGSVKKAAPGLTPQTQKPLDPKTVTVDGDNIVLG
jgi:Rieske Fe-S protein